MSDLGAIGSSTGGSQVAALVECPLMLRHVQLGDADRMVFGARKEAVEGDPASPCVAVTGRYERAWRLRLPVRTAGSHTLTCRVKQVDALAARPSIAILENPEQGIAFQESVAPAGSDWVSVGPINFTTVSPCGVEVELRVGNSEYEATAYFDKLKVSQTEPFDIWFRSVPVLGFRRYSFIAWLNGAPIADSDFAFDSRRRVATISPML